MSAESDHFINCHFNDCQSSQFWKSVSEGATTRLRDLTFGSATPLGPFQYSDSRASAQEAAESSGHFRCRRCLLKGCERTFRPTHPRCHYCSDACRREAKKWQAWRSAGRWRATDRGKECRRAQSRRYRRLIPLVLLAEAPAPSPEPVAEPITPPPVDAEPAPPEAREGQLIEQIPEDLVVRPCKRPGCYVLFGVPAEWSPRRFCCSLCHKALRRVLDREARYQRRRRAGVRPRPRPVAKPRK
jgi:hypothetical protein